MKTEGFERGRGEMGSDLQSASGVKRGTFGVQNCVACSTLVSSVITPGTVKHEMNAENFVGKGD